MLPGSEKPEGDAEMLDAEAQASAMAKSIKAQAAGDAAATGQENDDDLAAYKLDEYDEEESKGAGKSSAPLVSIQL